MQKEMEAKSEAVSKKNILKQYFTNMPVMFPMIGLFLLFMTVMEALNYLGDSGYPAMYLLRPVILFLYFIFWAGACCARKWAALAFLCLTIINVAFYLFGPKGPDAYLQHAIGDILFLYDRVSVNMIFSFLLLFYFRRMK
jgi:hypothetical protein